MGPQMTAALLAALEQTRAKYAAGHIDAREAIDWLFETLAVVIAEAPKEG